MNENMNANPPNEREVEELMARYGSWWAEESGPENEPFLAEFSRRLEKESSLQARVVRLPQRYWKRTVSFAAAACLVGILAFSWWSSRPVGEVLFAHGDLSIQNSGKEDSDLHRGTVVETMADGEAMLSVDQDRVNLFLNSGTQLTFAEADSVRLDKGEIWVRVETDSGFFGIDTPQGFVHIHNTLFEMRIGEDETQVDIVQGEVSVGSPAGEKTLVPGNGAILKGSAAVPEIHPTQGDRTPEWAKELYEKAATARMLMYFPTVAR